MSDKGKRVSLYTQHKAKWEGCTRCELHHTRKNVVLLRGQVPCDVLFVGEAPGASEDVLGKPFKGPAGNLLQQIIDRVVHIGGTIGKDYQRVTYALTNLVACIPIDQEDGKKTAEPPVEAIEECGPRLEEVFAFARPKLIVCVGQLAYAWLHPLYKNHVKVPDVKVIHIDHPAYILRMSYAQRDLAVRRVEVVLNNTINDLLEKQNK